MEPGAKDLKSAQPYELSGLKVGDKVLAYGRNIAPDAKVFPAGILVVMKSEDVKAKQARDVADWSTRGTGGIVTAADPAAGTITISTRTATGTKPVIITTTKSTVLRRYAPDSTKFDDAKVAPFSAIVVGDQVRAKGTKNDDGTQFAADEVVSGHFQNLAGLIVGVDTSGEDGLRDGTGVEENRNGEGDGPNEPAKVESASGAGDRSTFQGGRCWRGAKAAVRRRWEGRRGTGGAADGGAGNGASERRSRRTMRDPGAGGPGRGARAGDFSRYWPVSPT